MKRFVDVHRGEIMAGKGEVVLRSDAQAPCLVIVARDGTKKVGGLAHAMFRTGGLDKEVHSAVLKDTEHAIEEMIDDMTMIGANRDDIEVSLITGENVQHDKGDPNYVETLHAALDILREKHIKMKDNVEEDAGDLHVILDVYTGEVSFK